MAKVWEQRQQKKGPIILHCKIRKEIGGGGEFEFIIIIIILVSEDWMAFPSLIVSNGFESLPF